MKRSYPGAFILLLIFLTGLELLCAAPLKINTYAEPSTIGRDEQLTYTIEITGERGFKALAPKLPSLEDFSLINMMTSTASNFSIINGNVSESVTKSFTYRLLPKRTGNLRIPAFSFEIGGQMYSTQQVNVRVLDLPRAGTSPQGKANPYSRGGNNPLYMQDPFDFNPGFEPIGDMEIVATPEKRSVFVGEPLLVTYRLYTSKPVSSLEINDEKDFGGYGKEVYNEPNRLNFESVNYKNQRYRTALLKVAAILPNRAGTIQLPQVTATVQLGAMGLFTEALKNAPVSITVNPLPEAGKPLDFSGAVGSFQMKESLKKSNIRVGEALEYTIILSGKGNFNQFSNPSYPEQQDFRIASPLTQNRIQAGVNGTRTITYLLIPKREGTYTLPGISFNWFDPLSGRYHTFQSQSRSISVKPGNVITYLSNVFQRDSIKQLTPFSPQESYKSDVILLNRVWYWLLIVLIVLSILPSWLLTRTRKLKDTDPEAAARRSSDKVLKKYMREAELAALAYSQGFYPKAEQGLMRYLSDKFRIQHRYSTNEKLYQLRLKGLDNELISKLESFLKRAQEARFMPGGFDRAALDVDLETLKQIISAFIRQPAPSKGKFGRL